MNAFSTFRSLFLGTALSLSVSLSNAHAQVRPQPESGYWVIESNLYGKAFTIVRMYTETHELLYEERIEGKRLSPQCRRDVRLLNTGLRNVLRNTRLAQQKTKSNTLLVTIARL